MRHRSALSALGRRTFHGVGAVLFIFLLLAVAFFSNLRPAAAVTSTWTNPNGGTTVNALLWNVGTNWDTNPVFPNGVGDVANIQNAQPSNRLIDFGDNQAITIGTLNLKNESAFFNQLGTINHGVTLTFDNTGTSDAVFNITGHGTTSSANGNSIRVNIVLNDNLHLSTEYTK